MQGSRGGTSNIVPVTLKLERDFFCEDAEEGELEIDVALGVGDLSIFSIKIFFDDFP